MRFDFAADPWATAMLAAAALWLLSLLVVIAAFVAGTSRRAGGRLMLASLVAFLGAAAGGTWVEIREADAIASRPPPPEPTQIVAKTPPPDEPHGDDATGEGTGGGLTSGGLEGPAASTGVDGSTGTGGTGGSGEAGAGTSGTDTGEGSDGGGSSTGFDDGGASTGEEPAVDPLSDPVEPAVTKVPERVVPQSLPQVAPLPTEPKAREAAIRDILEDARKAAGGGKRCGNLERVAEAWARLRMIPVDRDAKEVAADLETCRRKLLYTISRRHRADRVAARDAYFEKLRDRMREEHGLMVQAAISGKSHERLRIGNPQLDATRADALMDGGLRAELMDLEFAHVVLSNGKKTRTYEFEVPPESELGLPDLRAVGLGEPLELGR